MKNFTKSLATLFAKLFRKGDKNQKDNHKSFKRNGYAMFICLSLLAINNVGFAQSTSKFNDGYLTVFKVTSGATLANTGTAIAMEEYNTSTANQSAPNFSVAVPSASGNKLIVSGTATSAGEISRSENGRYIILPGYNGLVGDANSTFTTNGALRTINGTGTVGAGIAASATQWLSSSNNVRGGTSDDGTNFWVTGNGVGIQYINSATSVTTVSTTSTNNRGSFIYNGQLYLTTGSGSQGIYSVGTGKPTNSGNTSVRLFTPTNTDPYGFTLSPDGNTIYYVAASGGGIYRSTFNAGSWSAGTQILSLTGTTGIAVDWNSYSFNLSSANGAKIYASASSGSSPNFISTIVGANDNGTSTVAATTLRTFTTGTEAFRGLAFSPIKQTVSKGTNTPAAGNINTSANDVVLFQFNLSADEGYSTLKKVIVAQSGTATIGTGNEISNFRLIDDANNNGVYDNGETVLSTGIVSGSNITLSSISLSSYIAEGASKNFLLVGNVAAGATAGNTFIPAISSNKTLNSVNYTTNVFNAGLSYVNIGATAPTGSPLTIVSSCTSPAITSLTSNSAICEGNTLSFTLAATGTATLTYQWSGPNSYSSTEPNPSIANATTAATGTYTVTVTNGCGSSMSSTSATVNASPTATITPDGPTTLCSGGSVNLTASTETSYLWNTGSVTQSINVTATGNYVVTVTNSNNCTASSSPTSVTVNSNVTPSVSIGANPGSTICSGTNVTFTATPTNGGASPSYQWTLNGNNVGSNSDTYSNNSLANNDVVECVMTSNATCASPSTVTSNSITITVTTSVTPSVSIASDAGTTICSGTNVTFTATPANGGTTPSYQWKLNGNDVGTNSNSYSNNTLADQDVVTCVMTSSNSCASPTTATSNALTITVNPNVTPSLSIAAVPGSTICAGTSVTFIATPVNGGTPSYQWTKNGNNVGTNSATYTDVALANNDAIICTMTSTATCVTTTTAVSNTITMTVNANPSPSISGTLTFCTGGSTMLDAGAGYASYLWNTNETTQTITVTTAGAYTVTVSDGTCTGTSAPVSVTELSIPIQPGAFTTSSASVFQGQNGVAYIIPNVAGVTYTWSYSGTGATINGSSNSVTVDFSLIATNGTLSVTATNICGTSAARTIAVTVTPLPGTMRITEYMYNGGGAGGAGEFVEFTNVGTTTVDMTGWSFDDNSRVPGSQSLTAFGIVQPGESIILADISAATYRTNWNLCAGVKVIGGNANNLGREDEINLYDASSNLVDRLTYGDQTFAPGTIRTTTKSGWVNAAGLGNNLIAQWTLSAVADVEASFTSTLAEIGSPAKTMHAIVVYDPCVIINGAPTVVIDVTTTSNYLDGGVLVSPPTPYGLSGVIADVTDPASTLGIDFTINDDVTPVNSLTVTVASSNTTVVPNGNLNLTGSGASRNLKITPAAVGYSTITVTVNDGTNNTVYQINYAASDPAPVLIPANTAWHTGMSDGSDAIALDDNYYVSGDDELDILNVYSRSASGLPLVSYDYAANLALPDPAKPEVDVEAAARSTSVTNRVYWTGSMSNGKLPYDNKPNRDRLFATTVTGTGAATSFSFVGYYNIRTALLAWGDANGYNFTASAAAGVNPKGLAGFSLEGMVFGPDNSTLYLGLRAPLVPTSLRQNAVIAPILNFETWFNNGSPSGSPTFGAPIELNLDFRGIRDIIRLSNGTYIIVAGSPIDDGGINNLYKWSGNPNDAPVTISNTAGGILNIEGLMQVNDSVGQLSLTKLQIVSDGGAQVLYQDNNQAKDFSDLNLRKFRSDVLTGLDLNLCTGFSASIAQSGNTNLCAGDSVSLTATGAGTGNTYLWSTGATTQVLKIASSGTYTVTVTNTAGCSTTLSQSVTVTNALPSDFNGDHVTNTIDFLQLLGKFNQSCTCQEDLNNDGVVNTIDFLILLGEFNHTCM